ncbi:hypothetical protein CPLU01_11800 [Colletotrichum plurivorum]|uniref:Uncharacterized protein n=1 Tax=Colletotrichum plurivorum TaxID=2175906 RepID=A0A8H6K118_9PEZI|nr:hypothetical protein CPLU01_11800 [Colletotrichum plurivorum]
MKLPATADAEFMFSAVIGYEGVRQSITDWRTSEVTLKQARPRLTWREIGDEDRDIPNGEEDRGGSDQGQESRKNLRARLPR